MERVQLSESCGTGSTPVGETGGNMENVVIEIRAAEGGEDAKLLVRDQLSAYVKAADRGRL